MLSKKLSLFFSVVLLFVVIIVPIVEAHTLNESERPVGRQMSVLWSSIGDAGAAGRAQIDKVIADAVYANVDTVVVGFGPMCYILSEMYPENALYKLYGGATVRDDKVDYFINKAHAANISVWLSLQGMALSKDPCALKYLGAYVPKNISGGILTPNKLDWENPEGRRLWREMVLFMLKNHNFDGFWVEEPYSTITQSNTSAAKTGLLSWGITDKLVLQNHGYDPRSLYNYSTKTLPNYVITDMLHEHEMLITQSYKELHDEIRALGPNYQYPNFLIAVGLNMEFYSPNEPPNNIIGHRGAMWGHNITELSNKHYIDVWQSESSPATDSVDAYLKHLSYAVDHTPEILHTTGTYITDSALYPVIDRNFFNKVPVVQPNGGSYEAIFANVHLNRKCLVLTPDKTGCATSASMSPKEWLHLNPPKKPRNYIPIRLSNYQLTFSPLSGTYTSAQDVTISTVTPEATIYYTLDGSDPASSSTRAVYLSAIPISYTTTIKAKAFKDGLSPSATVSATYTINLSAVAAPSFTPAAGTYTTAQNVTISTATTGAVIHYTKDGTTPTEASPIYSTPINISSNTNLKAGAWKAGMTPSNITSAAYTISDSVNLLVNPGFESETRPWTFFTNGIGTFGTTSPGYEGNNAAKLALSRPGTNIQLFQAGITLTPNTRYRLSFAAYSSSGKDLTVNLIKHGSPYTNYGLSFTPNLGTSWQVFTTEFTTKGFANNVNDGRLFFWLASFAGAGDIYYIDNVKLETVSAPSLVATPVFSPAGGTYSSAQNVKISTVTADATIHYTIDGTTPTESSPVYLTPVTISSNTTLKAGAWKTGMTPSSISSATYTISTLVNLAPNPGFETDPAVYYAHFGSGTFTWASDFKHEGAKSLKIVSSQPTGALARWVSKREKISATAGKTYAASVWMKTNNVSQYGELDINFWDANFAYLGKTYQSNKVSGTTDWAKLTVSATAPAKTKYIRLEFRLFGRGTIWVDDVELK